MSTLADQSHLPSLQAPSEPGGRGASNHAPGAARRPGLTVARVGSLLRPSLWILLVLLILAPCACFLVLAISPRLFDQGPQWLTFGYLRGVFSGGNALALTNSLWVSSAAAGLGLAVGFPIAWATHRTQLPGRRLIVGGMWLVLIHPSWIPSLGWQRLVQPDGVLTRIGLGSALLTHAIMGPFGVVLLLALRAVPFTYLAISVGLGGLGQEFEDAARIHGATRLQALRMVAPILAPAIFSAVAINFAESISDFGVASTLAFNSHFPMATYQLYASINNFPPQFPSAAAQAWLLVAAVALPLAVQAKALRGRSYAVLSGRTRPARRRALTVPQKLTYSGAVCAFFTLALAVPAFGAVSGSLLADYGASFQVSFVNYRQVFDNSGLSAPLERSLVFGVITASITVVGGVIAARLLARRRTRSTKLLDFLLLASVALPAVVFGAGYIFAYNLPFLSSLGLDLYQTTTLLVVAYVASSLPTNARVLVGAVSQVQPSLHDAARTHGAGPIRAWGLGVLPALSRPIVMAWLLTFTGVFLELPLSQLLDPPGASPVSVAIQNNLGNYHFGVGIAQAVMAVVVALVAVLLVLGGYRLLAPRGWRRIGGGSRG